MVRQVFSRSVSKSCIDTETQRRINFRRTTGEELHASTSPSSSEQVGSILSFKLSFLPVVENFRFLTVGGAWRTTVTWFSVLLACAAWAGSSTD
jgi:hypothetical protein